MFLIIINKYINHEKVPISIEVFGLLESVKEVRSFDLLLTESLRGCILISSTYSSLRCTSFISPKEPSHLFQFDFSTWVLMVSPGVKMTNEQKKENGL